MGRFKTFLKNKVDGFKDGVQQVVKAKNVKDVAKGIYKTHKNTDLATIIHDEVIEPFTPSHLALKKLKLPKALGKEGEDVNMIDGAIWSVGLGAKTRNANLAKKEASEQQELGTVEMPNTVSDAAIAQALAEAEQLQIEAQEASFLENSPEALLAKLPISPKAIIIAVVLVMFVLILIKAKNR